MGIIYGMDTTSEPRNHSFFKDAKKALVAEDRLVKNENSNLRKFNHLGRNLDQIL
jgi:hypothetical protein